LSGEGNTPPLAADHNRSKLTTTARGGQRLSALQLPWFSVLPPRGFGVLTTTGRKTQQPRRTCVRAVRDGDTVFVVAIAGERAGWLRNLRNDPRAKLRIRGGTFDGVARDVREAERQRAEDIYSQFAGPFELLESLAHLRGRPKLAKIERMHRHWFRTGTPIAIDLSVNGDLGPAPP
jgi:deazaflavin-dependent oxidoreductase (nitroreductase family)